MTISFIFRIETEFNWRFVILKCFNCPYYKSAYMYNSCDITGDEYFSQLENCDLVNNDGSINYSSEYIGILGINMEDVSIRKMGLNLSLNNIDS